MIVKFNYNNSEVKPVTVSKNVEMALGHQGKVIYRTPEMSQANSFQSAQSAQAGINPVPTTIVRASSSENRAIKVQGPPQTIPHQPQTISQQPQHPQHPQKLHQPQ